MTLKILLSIFLAFCSYPTWAEEQQKGAIQTQESPKKIPKRISPLFYWDVNLLYLNDFQNGSLFINMDDRYTYGLGIVISLNNWDIYFHYRPLTDRYRSQTRIDEMEIGARYTWGNLLNPDFWMQAPSHYSRRPEGGYQAATPWYLGGSLSLGYFQAGDIAGQSIQNFMHELSGVPKVYNDYLGNNTYTFSLELRTYLSYTFPLRRILPKWEDSLWQWGLEAHAGIAMGYQERVRLGMRSKLYSGNQYLQFDFYLQQLGHFEGWGNNVKGLWSGTNTAFWFAFSSRSGLYQRRVDFNFGSLSNPSLQDPFGFGSLELSWAHLQEKKDFVTPDYSQSIMMGIGNNLVVDRLAFLFRFAEKVPGALSFVMIRELAGDPNLFRGNPLARSIESFWILMLDIRPTLQLGKFGYLEFYAGVGAGIYNMQFLNSVNTLSSRSSFQYFSLAGQAGLRWYGLALRRSGAVYGIEAALMTLFPFSDRESSVNFASTGILIYNLQPKLNFMIGITVLTDL